MTAQELYTDTVRFLDKQEQARLAALILNAMEQTDIPLDRSDRFFTQDQITRLHDLMQRTHSNVITDAERNERDTLIETELLASASRTAALADALGK